MDRMIFFTGQKRSPHRTLLNVIRGADKVRSMLVFIITLTFFSPAAFGLAHGLTDQSGPGDDLGFICSADGSFQVSPADEASKRPGWHCVCTSGCAISCCGNTNALAGSFIGFSGREQILSDKALRQGSSRERDGPPARITAIRAPPSF